MLPRRLLVPALLAATSACSDDPSGPSGLVQLAVTPAAISISQGSTGSVTVSVTRASGFSNPVTLVVTGLPAGVTTTITPDELVGANASTVIEIAVGSAVAAGAYIGSIAAAAEGSAEATLGFQLTVTASGTIQYLFCSQSSVPVFAAFQDGAGAWQRVAGTSSPEGTRFNVTLTQSRGGVLFVYREGAAVRGVVEQLREAHRPRSAVGGPALRAGEYRTEVFFGTPAELAEDAPLTCQQTGETGSFDLSVAGVPAGSYGIVSLGEVTHIMDGAVPADPMTFAEVALAPLHLVASRTSPGAAPDKLVILRDLDVGGVPASIDFNGPSTITPVTATVTITGGGEDLLEAYTDVALGNVLVAALWADLSPSTGSVRPWAGFPADALHANEFHSLVVFASPGGSPDFRVVQRYLGPVANQAMAMGPVMPEPTVSAVAIGAYPRFRFQGAIPADYGRGLAVEIAGGNAFGVFATAGWLTAGGSLTAYDISMPDVAGLTGFPIASRLTAGDNEVSVSAFTFNGPGAFDLRPQLGREFRGALTAMGVVVP